MAIKENLEEIVYFKDVEKIKTEEYFKGNSFSIDTFKKKYTLSTNPNESYVEAIKRVCDFVASVEKTKELRQYWSERWFDEIYSDWWHPGGSIMQGAGSGRKISLANCFSGETEFITNKGVRKFNDFDVGSLVKILNNYGGFVNGLVEKHGKQRLYKLTVGKNTIKKDIYCTLDHIWRVIKSGGTIVEKTTEDLEEGDLLPHVKRKWMSCKKGSRYYCPIGWIHGYVFGDGDYDNATNTCNAYFCGDSREMLSKFSGFNWIVKSENDKDSIRYLPLWMKNLPDISKENEEYLLGFIIGYFAADGTVDPEGRASLSSSDIENLLFVKNIGESVGIYTSDIKLTRNESPFDGNVDQKLYRLNINKDCLFDSFFSKKTHIEKWEHYKANKQNDKLSLQWKVISLEETDRTEDVWCLSVSDGENFTLQGGVNTHNCNTISMGNLRTHEEWDSLEAIIKNTAYSVAKSAAYRQGVGIDFSRLRPKGTKVKNSANESTGSIHWMQFIDQIGYFVGQKGRIPAMLFSLSCSHPDIEEFVSIKSDRTKIQNANISVHCTEDFYKAVEDNKDWTLEFVIPPVKKGDKVYIDEGSVVSGCHKDEKGHYYLARMDREKESIKKVVKARKLMMLIAENMHKNAEPGIQNIDVARKYSNSDYVYDENAVYDSRIISTNACSEQFLSRESVCILSSINCGKFDINPEKYDKQLEKIACSIARFLDNVNECEVQYGLYATQQEKIAIEQLRRIGAGVTNIAGWFFKSDVTYGSNESVSLLGKFMERYVYHLYKTSISLGQEKGSFGLFNRKKLEQSPFVQRMIKLGLEFKSLRNVTLSTIAPTGTISLMFRDMVMGYGIEPSFGMYFWKRTRMGGKYEYYFVVPSLVREKCKELGIELPTTQDAIKDDWDGTIGKEIAKIIENNKEKICNGFKSSENVTADNKLQLMTAAAKWIDSSISVTYMLPEDSTPENVYSFVMKAHKNEIKGISVFPEKKMYGIVSTIPFKDLAIQLTKEKVGIHHQNFSDEELKQLNMSKDDIVLNTSNSPKREKTLSAEIYKISVNKENFIVAIGLQNNYPYEIFGGKLNGLSLAIQQKHITGEITKVSSGKYSLKIGDVCIEDFSQQFTPVEKMLFRSLSLMLRHGIPIQFIVEQLSKANDDMFTMSAAVTRVLKKYIKDGQRVSGKSCPMCGGQLIYIDGCVKCPSCPYSLCE